MNKKAAISLIDRFSRLAVSEAKDASGLDHGFMRGRALAGAWSFAFAAASIAEQLGIAQFVWEKPKTKEAVA